jgi:ABC-type transporter Mla maintaining outer membrane lipid asymmetry ATPase subunit MlaF
MSAAIPVLELSGIVRGYQSLRPLRIESLIVTESERVAVLGIDAPGAEVLVNLVTGAALPEQGTVRVLGRNTTDISNGDDWLASLDRFGIVSPRAVLIEAATVEQNLAMPFTLQIDPVPADVAERVSALAHECGIRVDGNGLKQITGEASAGVRARIHLARALASSPALLILEHPTAGLPEADRGAFAADVSKAIEGRRTTTLAITQDRSFASRVAQRTLELQPASGVLKPVRKGWFGSRSG